MCLAIEDLKKTKAVPTLRSWFYNPLSNIGISVKETANTINTSPTTNLSYGFIICSFATITRTLAYKIVYFTTIILTFSCIIFYFAKNIIRPLNILCVIDSKNCVIVYNIDSTCSIIYTSRTYQDYTRTYLVTIAMLFERCLL